MHYTLIFIIGFWIFSAIVEGMPKPVPASSLAYIWTYQSLQWLAGNIRTAIKARFSSIPLPDQTQVEQKP